MGGGEESSSDSLSSEYVYLADGNPQSTILRSHSVRKKENGKDNTEHDDDDDDDDKSLSDIEKVATSITLEDNIEQARKANTHKQVLANYSELQRRGMDLSYLCGAKEEIRRYFPGKWAENVNDCDAPKTTTLLLVGPMGCGKSSLVNRISKVFDHDKFGVDRAQVSYDSSGGGTCFLQEYRIPKHSKSFCLFDTRSLSDDSSENTKDFEKWMTEGVRHGDPVIRDSDSASLKSRIEGSVLSQGHNVSKKMVNFVIFVVDGLSVLKCMEGDDEEAKRQWDETILTTFNCPFLSFRGDKPVVAVTHGDLLSISDRVRIRIHLGELLGIHPTKQIFDIPDNYDEATDMAIVDMLRYALEHADRNLSCNKSLIKKVSSFFDDKTLVQALNVLLVACMLLILVMGSYMAGARVSGTHSCRPQNHPAPPPMDHCPPPPDSKVDHQLPTHSCSAQNHPAPPPGTKTDHPPPPLATTKVDHQPPTQNHPAPPLATKVDPQPPTHSCSAQNHPALSQMYHHASPRDTKVDLQPPTHSCSAQAPPLGMEMYRRPPPPDTKVDLQTPPPDTKMDHRPLPLHTEKDDRPPPSAKPKKQSFVQPKKKRCILDSKENWYALRSRVRALIRNGLYYVYD